MKLFGLDVVKKDRGYFGVRQCSQCGGLKDVHLLELTGVDRFLFIPVKKHVTKRYLHCASCDALFTLSDEQWDHYKSYLHHRLSKKTTEEIISTLNDIHKVYEEQGVKIDIDDKIYHPALDEICENLIKKYGHKENMEELISVFFISKQKGNS